MTKTATMPAGVRLFNLLLQGGGTEEQKRLYWERYADQAEKQLGKPLWDMDAEEFEEYKILEENQSYGTEDGGSCNLCRNRGYIVRRDGQYTRYASCSCMEQRKQSREVQNSGYAEKITSQTFEKFTITEPWQKQALQTVKAWTRQTHFPFLFLGGRSGAGKTHLAVAAFYNLIQRGVRGKFISWREQSRELKMRMKEAEAYDAKIRELKFVPLLLVDDLLWANGGGLSEEDFKLAKEIIDVRQANGLRTIFTANWTIKDLIELSEVIGGRIYEGCGSSTNFVLTFGGDTQNHRARKQSTLLEIAGIESPFNDDDRKH